MISVEKETTALVDLFKAEPVEILKVSLTGHPVDFQFKAKTKSLHVDVLDLFLHSEGYVPAGVIARKASILRGEGLSYIQIFHDELAKPSIVKSIILSRLGLAESRFYARELTLKPVPIKDCRRFFDANHLMGYRVGRTVGLYSGNEIICALSYSIKKDNIAIERFCTKLNASCAGGFSKLVSHITSFKKPIVSFCDLRYSDGHSYESTGFVNKGETLGWSWTNGSERFNRLRCRATTGHTEKENAVAKGWFKIFDAGQRKYMLDV